MIDMIVRQQTGKLIYQGAVCHAYDLHKDPDGIRESLGISNHPILKDARWRMLMRGYGTTCRKKNLLRTAETAIQGEGVAILHFDKAGYLLDEISGVQTAIDKEMLEYSGNDPDIIGMGIVSMTTWILGALSFLYRKTEVEHINPNRQARKEFARATGKKKGAADLVDYYLIKVKPHARGGKAMNLFDDIEPLRNKGRSARSHSVRGHFRRVGVTGLFGRGDHAEELIWIPDHTRGDATKGTIHKGYKLEE